MPDPSATPCAPPTTSGRAPASEADARALLERARAIADGLERRDATLVGQTVCLVSNDPDDVLLARLLRAYGAQVTFLCPAAVTWSADYHPGAVRCLGSLLEDSTWGLDLDVFADGERPGVPTEVLGLDELPGRQGEPFDLVFAVAMLPAEGQAATRALGLLSGLAKVNGMIELFDDRRAPLPDGTARHVEAAAGHLGLGLRRAQRNPLRLGFVRLDGPLYDHPAEEAGNPQMMAHCRSRLEFVSGFVAGLDVLEAGCATGIGARLFAAAGARRVVGLELLPELLDEARRKTCDPRVEYRQANLNERLPYDDASFDLVVCTEVLEHITHHEHAIAEFLRVLRPGGRLIISVPDRALEDSWTAVNRYGNPYHLRVPTPEQFARLLEPFAAVRHYRQLDVVGTVVVADDDGRPQGEYLSDLDNVTSDIRAVRLAVCTKAPAGREGESYRPGRLRLYRTFTDYQLQHHQNSMNLTDEIVWDRHRHWQQMNRWRFELSREARQRGWQWRPVQDPAELIRNLARDAQLDQTVTLWRLSGGPLLFDQAVEPGPWLATLAGLMRKTPAERVPTPVGRGAPAWRLTVSAEGPELTLLPDPGAGGKVRTVLFPVAEDRVKSGALWQWRRRGAEKFWFFEEDGWRVLDAEASFARRLYRRTFGRFCRLAVPWLLPRVRRTERRVMQWAAARRGRHELTEQVCSLAGTPEIRVWADWIARANERLAQGEPLPGGRPLRVLQYIGALYSGGAERQLCNLSIGLARRGLEVAVRTTHDATGDRGHYNHLLEEHGLKVLTAGHGRRAAPAAVDDALLAVVPPHLRPHVLALREEILALKPDVLHCWLDEPNLIGAIAGLLAGVPRVLLSMRNSNPTHFPRFYHAYMADWYRLLARSHRVHLLSNSRSGADSYAGWMGVPFTRFHLVANGMIFDHFPARTPEARRAARAAFGLAEGDKVVCGVFRLDEEKQPDVFLRVAQEVARRVPELRVLLAGTGALARQVETAVRQSGMDRYLKVLGSCKDVGAVFLASDVMLLTSAFEGCPNAVIEAQYLGVPVVATRGGGTADSVLHGRTGYLTAVGDAARLADHLTEVLADDAHRARLSEQAQAFARQEFSVDQMVDLTLLAYYRMFEPAADSPRVVTPLLARLEAAERTGKAASVPLAPPRGTAACTRRSPTPPETVANCPELTPEEERLVQAVEGPLHAHEVAGLHRLARLARGPVVELGAHLGQATLALLLGAAKSAQRVYAVAPWLPSDSNAPPFVRTPAPGTEDFLAFSRHVQAYRERLSVLCCRGRRIRWEGPPITGLFLGPARGADQLRADLGHYLPWLGADARVALHGFSPEATACPGVWSFIEEGLLAGGEWWWDDLRGDLLTLQRVRRSKRAVLEHNQRCLQAARERVRAVTGAHEEACLKAG
jgi:glycosyltransferase involved in cell wall biosynthesis/2-polyprenyl-3-methyl-5-hydroxy-6-metoxy-1,4-benzoquinol methylase